MYIYIYIYICVCVYRNTSPPCLFDIPIYYIDERYSTVQAEDKLMNAGIRPSKNQKKIDSAAAAIILQSYLDKIK